MKIRLLVNETKKWNPDTVVAAGEELVVRNIEELAKRGYDITVYRTGEKLTFNGVKYESRDDFIPEEFSEITLIRKDSNVLGNINSLYIGYWTDELDAKEKLMGKEHLFDDIICISNWQNKTYFNRKAKVVPLGIDRELYLGGIKEEYSVLYASSPDRGLDVLLNCWDKVRKRIPNAKLYITYLNYSEKEMIELYKKCDVWAYPCTGVEMYCQTATKAQAAGCVPVVIPFMALKETVKHGVLTTPEAFCEDLIETLLNKSLKTTIRERLSKVKFYSWGESTDKLEELWQHLKE